MSASKRYAVYWVPKRTHPLWEAGCAWLGRDPENYSRSFPLIPFTVTPRRYGFHATLKAPLRLVEGVSEETFFDAVNHIASTTSLGLMPTLEVRTLADFIALRPVERVVENEGLHTLAARCVTELDCFRAPFSDREWIDRTMGLDAEQRVLTSELGYHFVLHRWRFHMTLSDSFPLGSLRGRAHMQEAARAHFRLALEAKMTAGDIAIYVEPGENAPFVLAHRLSLEQG